MANQQEASASDSRSPEDHGSRTHSLSLGTGSSNESSIFNALRASSTTGDNALPPQTERVDSRMAANVAMFWSLSASGESTPGRLPEEAPGHARRHTDRIGRPRRIHLSPYRARLASTGDLMQPPGPGQHSPRVIRPRVDSTRSPRWPANVKSPTSPAVPDYPPPARSPTPPGIPSFGSEEARSYDFRFTARPPAPNRSESLLRRLFQRTPNPSPPQNSSQQRSRIYAADGTAVLGSFPQRQSGHGTNVSRGLDDHPFHRQTLPHAQCDGTDAQGSHAVPGGPENTESRPSPEDESHDDDGESTLLWLEERLREQPPSPTRDSALPNPVGIPIKKADSYHTCVSGVQEGSPRQIDDRVGYSFFDGAYPPSFLERTPEQAPPSAPTTTQEGQGGSLLSGVLPACFLTPTQSAGPIAAQETSESHSNDNNRPAYWLQLKRRVKPLICCCCAGPEEGLEPLGSDTTNTTSDIPTNTATQETYLTARDQSSNESQQPHPSAPTGEQSRPGDSSRQPATLRPID
ncbi:hypothetical protein BJX61DRAFT_494568 [Aspergillus egyptiacus]|nr:hypothetical protein BJX61DRAFT_494568 [Aspergillus egyptiacus]